MQDYKEEQSVVRPLWAITWRSFVFIPVMIIFGTFLVGVALCLVVLPLFVVVFAYYHLWQLALGYLTAWLILCVAWRVFRLRRFFEWPPSFL
jgi:hypothetical protein